MNVQLNILKENLEDAIQDKQYERAAEMQKQIVEVEGKIKDVTAKREPKKVVKTGDNTSVLCHNLSILQGILLLPGIKMCDSLRFCKDEYVLPAFNNFNLNVMLRVYKCIGLFGLLDETVAKEYVKLLFSHVSVMKILLVLDATKFQETFFLVKH